MKFFTHLQIKTFILNLSSAEFKEVLNSSSKSSFKYCGVCVCLCVAARCLLFLKAGDQMPQYYFNKNLFTY